MKRWQWVREDVVHAIHDRQLAEHGGPAGVRDEAALESALALPRNLAPYQRPYGAARAAAYAYGIIRNHLFVDGNKRTGWVVARLILAPNGYRSKFDPHDAVRTIERLAAENQANPRLTSGFDREYIENDKSTRTAPHELPLLAWVFPSHLSLTTSSVVILQPEVRDHLLAHQVAHRVLQLHRLDEQVVLRIQPRGRHRRLKVKAQPLLDADTA